MTKSALAGNSGRFSMRLRKYFVSLKCDGRFRLSDLASGWMKWVIYDREGQLDHHILK